MWETRKWFLLFFKKKVTSSVFIGKTIFFKKKQILKLMKFHSVKFHGTNKFPAAKYSIVGNCSTKKCRYGWQNTANLALKIFEYNAMRF